MKNQVQYPRNKATTLATTKGRIEKGSPLYFEGFLVLRIKIIPPKSANATGVSNIAHPKTIATIRNWLGIGNEYQKKKTAAIIAII